MHGLEIQGVEKSFGGTPVLRGVDFSVQSGEFFTLLGPSGCGKTTLLRIIAGFQPQDAGEVLLAGERLDPRPAHKRDVGMVFQDYALFPHLSVADNIAFGLRARALPRALIEERVREGLAMVRLEGLGARLPAQLSGGQQQRVGLARAMAIRPKLLLMDEPLSNLDAKLRIELREDIRDIQRKLGITTVYVTHDQEEALAISDRICVMNQGRIEQIGAPYDIYRAPARRFAAAFVGAMNFLPAEVMGGRVHLTGAPLAVRAGAAGKIDIAIRPENVSLAPGASARAAILLEGEVRKITFLGREAQYALETPAGPLLAQAADPDRAVLALAGAKIQIALPFDKLAAFKPDGGGVDLEPMP